MRAESGGRRDALTRAGAMGLMQLMPATWLELRQELSLGNDPYGPRDNILAGTFYLKSMHERFGYPGLFAAYNAGPDAYAQYLAGKRSLPAETITYVASLTGESLRAETALERDAAYSPIFFPLP
jgi:soluble lytic murein transglycosylase-like protein